MTPVDADILPPAAVADALSRLVDQSLVVAQVTADDVRYRMLESIRTYAAERLNASANAVSLRRKHAEAMVRIAEASVPAVLGPEQRAWLGRLRLETPNWRTALSWCLEECGSPAPGV